MVKQFRDLSSGERGQIFNNMPVKERVQFMGQLAKNMIERIRYREIDGIIKEIQKNKGIGEYIARSFSVIDNGKADVTTKQFSNEEKDEVIATFKVITQHFFAYLQKKYQNAQNELLFPLIINVQDRLNSILYLYMHEEYMGAISAVRPLLEACVIYSVIRKYPTELSKPYTEHSLVRSYLLLRENKEIPNDQLQKLENEYKRLVQIYGKDFGNDYGWAIAKFKETGQLQKSQNKILLADLAEFIEFGNKELRKITNEFLHSSSFSMTIEENIILELANECFTESFSIFSNITDKFMDDICCGANDKDTIRVAIARFKELLEHKVTNKTMGTSLNKR